MKANRITMDNIRGANHANRTRFLKMITHACEVVVGDQPEIVDDIFDEHPDPSISVFTTV